MRWFKARKEIIFASETAPNPRGSTIRGSLRTVSDWKVISLETLIISLFFLASGCYRMPEQGEYSLIPTTNNPDITRESQSSWTPSLGY